MFIRSDQLTETQLKDLEELAQNCRASDQGVVNYYPNLLSQQRSYEGSILAYQDGRLMAFIAIFFFEELNCEISLMVRPEARGQGIATELLGEMLLFIRQYRVNTLLFTAPQSQADWLKKRGLQYLHSEYHMQRQDENKPALLQSPLQFRLGTAHDMDAMLALNQSCFPVTPGEDVLARFHYLFEQDNYQMILASLGEKIIAKAHIRWQEKGAIFSDIAVLPAYQGKGYGAALLAYCIAFCLDKGKSQLALDVEANNLNALKLYQRQGFVIANVCDYWSIPIQQLP